MTQSTSILSSLFFSLSFSLLYFFSPPFSLLYFLPIHYSLLLRPLFFIIGIYNCHKLEHVSVTFFAADVLTYFDGLKDLYLQGVKTLPYKKYIYDMA